MSKLTENQIAALSSASLRTDGAMTPPPKLKGAALAKIAKGLIDRKLAREMRAKADMPIWRRDDEKRNFGLVITAAGRKMLSADAAVAEAVKVSDALPLSDDLTGPSADTAPVIQAADEDQQVITLSAAAEPEASATLIPPEAQLEVEGSSEPAMRKAPGKEPRAGTKQALVIEMLNRPNGAGITELIIATDWLAHTTRAMITGLRKRGYQVERVKDDDQTSRYRILGRTEALAENAKVPPTLEPSVEGA